MMESHINNVLKEMSNIRENKLENRLEKETINSSKKIKEELETIQEIIQNKNKLLYKLSNVVKNESDNNLSIILENHKKYITMIEEYIESFNGVKLELTNCVNLLENKLLNNLPILEIIVKSKSIGKFKEIKYDCSFDTDISSFLIRIDLKNILDKIKTIDSTKRQIFINMIYDEGHELIYNIKFDLKNIDENNTVKGSFTTIRQ